MLTHNNGMKSKLIPDTNFKGRNDAGSFIEGEIYQLQLNEINYNYLNVESD